MVTIPRRQIDSLKTTKATLQKALGEALREALVPEETIQAMVHLLNEGVLKVDDMGYIYLTQKGMDQLAKLLRNLEIPREAKKTPLTIFKASLEKTDSSDMRLEEDKKTALLFFTIPRSFLGKTADGLHVVKILSADQVFLFTQVFSPGELKDGCSAVAKIEQISGEATLKKFLTSKDLITSDCLIALTIKDGGSFDLDGRENGSVTDPAFIIEGEEKNDPDPEPSAGTSGGGCSVGFIPLAMLILALPLVLLKR